MLPSKGYFSGMPCPFYDSSICERPHCHFRHSKKDKTNSTEEEITKSEKDKNVNIIKELVTETVKHVLSHTEIRDKTENKHLNTDAIVTDVVKTFQPDIESKIDTSKKDFSSSNEIPSYKPTPISELNKKHIPVVYAPTRPNYLDRFKKKDIKESGVYTPRSISENNHPSTTYIPSSSKARCEAYSPENVSSYRLYKTQITGTQVSDAHDVSAEDNDLDTKDIDNENTLKALDKLIEEEFDDKPPLTRKDSSDKCHAVAVTEPESCVNVPKNTKDGSYQIIQSCTEESSSKTKSCESKHSPSKQKGRSHDGSSRHGSSNERYSHSKSKSSSIDKSSKSSTSEEKSSNKSLNNEPSSKSNTSDIKPKSKTHSSDSSSKLSSSDDKNHSRSSHSKESSSKHRSSHGHSKSKSSSTDSSKHHSTSQDKHCRSKSKNSSSSSSKKCVKDKSKSSHHKEKSKSNNVSNSKEKKHDKSTSLENKLSKKKEDHRKSNKIKDKPQKDTSPKKISHESSTLLLQSDSMSSNSDLEEILCAPEPILIDSSSLSSFSSVNEYRGELSDDSQSPKTNFNYVSEASQNILSSASEETCDSPPPAKRLKEDDEDSKAPVSMFPSLFSDRWKKARETVKKSSTAGKIKIAHVPNVVSILSAKDKIIAKTKSPPKDDLTHSKKTEDAKKELVSGKRLRKAHVPSQERPSLIMEENLKVPVSIRQLCLNNLYDEYLKYCDEDKARIKAQSDEIEICRRLHVPKTYQNAVALSLLKIRKLQGRSEKELEMISSNSLSSDSVPEYTYGWTIYKCFSEYLMKEEEFVSHGFPIKLKSKPGCGYIEKTARRYDVKQPDDPNLRICANCSNSYYVDDKGYPVKEYDCFYHWGRLARARMRLGGITEFYRCCNGEVGAEPCTNGRYHVCSSYNEDCLEGFVESRPSDDDPEKAGIYAMDCEMCYTTKGLDLTRCTVVDINGKMVYDEVIVPESPILDYNTRFSGITEEMVQKSKKKLRHVQRDLLKFINEKSILVGHSLENDFKALRLFHRTVVDTSIVFPHHLGLPYKRALKLIAKDILKINIQENESGHDSYEDANTCMLIMMAKIKEDAKKRKPRVIISLDSKGRTKT